MLFFFQKFLLSMVNRCLNPEKATDRRPARTLQTLKDVVERLTDSINQGRFRNYFFQPYIEDIPRSVNKYWGKNLFTENEKKRATLLFRRNSSMVCDYKAPTEYDHRD